MIFFTILSLILVFCSFDNDDFSHSVFNVCISGIKVFIFISNSDIFFNVTVSIVLFGSYFSTITMTSISELISNNNFCISLISFLDEIYV